MYFDVSTVQDEARPPFLKEPLPQCDQRALEFPSMHWQVMVCVNKPRLDRRNHHAQGGREADEPCQSDW